MTLAVVAVVIQGMSDPSMIDCSMVILAHFVLGGMLSELLETGGAISSSFATTNFVFDQMGCASDDLLAAFLKTVGMGTAF